MAVNARKPQPLPNLSDPVVDRHRRFTKTWFRWLKPLLDTTVDLKLNLVATAADVATNTAAITTEAAVRASADTALSNQITTLSATVDTNTAAIATEATARATADTALSGQITSLTATVNSNTAAITTEATARATADTALSTQITSLTTTVADNTAAITTEQTARIAADGVITSNVTSLTTAVAGNTASISTLSSSIDGIEARWGVSVNVNNRVVGAVQLDGAASGSTFAVLADKFIIVHPSVNSTEIQAFITGLVDGISTVGINGNLIVDGTIVARHIDVSSLSAITADVGTVTAGVIQSTSGNMVIDLDNGTITIDT